MACPLGLDQRRLRRLLRTQARRTHKDDRVLDVMVLEAMERLQILRENAQSTRILALQEPAILIGLGLAVSGLASFFQNVSRLRPASGSR